MSLTTLFQRQYQLEKKHLERVDVCSEPCCKSSFLNTRAAHWTKSHYQHHHLVGCSHSEWMKVMIFASLLHLLLCCTSRLIFVSNAAHNLVLEHGAHGRKSRCPPYTPCMMGQVRRQTRKHGQKTDDRFAERETWSLAWVKSDGQSTMMSSNPKSRLMQELGSSTAAIADMTDSVVVRSRSRI